MDVDVLEPLVVRMIACRLVAAHLLPPSPIVIATLVSFFSRSPDTGSNTGLLLLSAMAFARVGLLDAPFFHQIDDFWRLATAQGAVASPYVFASTSSRSPSQ